MARIDDPTIYNPYGWRHADLADTTTSPQRRRALLDELLVCEAEELAHGLRHLTIVHGDPQGIADSRHLSTFYDTLRVLASSAEWVRVRGTVDRVTITIGGHAAQDRVDELVAAAHAADPGYWAIAQTASLATRTR